MYFMLMSYLTCAARYEYCTYHAEASSPLYVSPSKLIMLIQQHRDYLLGERLLDFIFLSGT